MVSTLMTVSEVGDAVETGAPDSILQIYIDAADEDIQRSAGPHDLERTVSRVIDYDNRAFDVLLAKQGRIHNLGHDRRRWARRQHLPAALRRELRKDLVS